jgi:hypothetical protein
MNITWTTCMIAEYERKARLQDAEHYRLAQIAQGRGKHALTSLTALLSALLAALHIA